MRRFNHQQWRDEKSPLSCGATGFSPLLSALLCYSRTHLHQNVSGAVMAENHHPHGEHTQGTMDIRDHVKTWLAFWNIAKWSTFALIVLAGLLFLFRTHNGY